MKSLPDEALVYDNILKTPVKLLIHSNCQDYILINKSNFVHSSIGPSLKMTDDFTLYYSNGIQYNWHWHGHYIK